MKVVFDIPQQSVSIEGDGPDLVKLLEVVREVAPNLPSISINASTTPEKPVPLQSTSSQSDSNGGSGETVRQFTRRLSLGSNSEKVAAIAHYKQEVEGVDSFTPNEMGQWFTICGFQKPSQMSVAIHDARKRHGYVESCGHGRWRLTTNGLNLIIGKLNDNDAEE